MNEQIEMFHDGACPLCAREVRMLRRLDRGGRIRFTDISEPGFSASRYGKTQAAFEARIKARTADGAWLDGVDVFRALYEAVGFGAVVRATRLPVVRNALDVGYEIFARNRLRLTGRSGACADACAVKPS